MSIGPVLRPPTVACILAATLLACSTRVDPVVADQWVGTVSQTGSVTTVVNEAGSLWGAPARLVEEASIGVAEGEDEYQLGGVTSVWATDDRIVLADPGVPVVRAYDRDGRYLFDVGRGGEGPGEYNQPYEVAIAPGGNIMVSETSARLHIYEPDGTPKATYSAETMWTLFMPNTFVVSDQGVPYKAVVDDAGTNSRTLRTGRQALGPAGPIGEATFPPQNEFTPPCRTYMDARSGESRDYCSIPFAPQETRILTSGLSWVVGTGASYAFTVHRSDGSETRIQRNAPAVPTSPAERAYRRLQTAARMQRFQPGWAWNGPAIPEHKPAFVTILPDRSGRFWVTREAPSHRVAGACTEDFSDPELAPSTIVPCWAADTVYDVFAPDGRYLGEVPAPENVSAAQQAFIDGDVFVIAVMDESGVVRVKRYRLRPPAPDGGASAP